MTEDARRLLIEGLVDYAGLFPPAALSMMADIFKVTSRGGAAALYGSAQCLGLGLGVMIGGWLRI